MQISRITGFSPIFTGSLTPLNEKNENKIKKPELKLAANNSEISPKGSDPLNKDGKINLQVKKMLDESSFIFDTKEGVKVMTIKEFIKSNILEEGNTEKSGEYYIDPTVKFSADNTLENKGFDCSKNLNSLGISVAQNIENSNSKKIHAELKGNMATLNPDWHEKIYNSCASDRITQFTGNKRSRADEALNTYVKNLMVEDFKIDMGYSNGNIICFNPSAISNIKEL